MKWLTRTLAVTGVLVALLALFPLLVSLDDYVPALESELSTRLKRPVTITGVRAALFPVPHGVLTGVAIGDSDEIKVETVTLKPAFWSLFGDARVIRSIDFEDVALTSEALAGLLALTRGREGESRLRIEAVRLRNAVVKLEKGAFGPLDADARLSDAAGAGEFVLRTRDGALEVRATPQGERHAVTLAAKDWHAPLGPGIRFDALDLEGFATAKGAVFDAVSAKLYSGAASGRISLDWAQGLDLKGELDIRQVDLKAAAALFAPQTRVSGRLDAKPVFKASAPNARGLDEALQLQTPFTVHNGVLHGFDLGDAAAILSRQGGGSGGETRFDELSGRLATEGRTYRFSELRIAAAGLAARGHVTVTPSRALDGALTTSLAGGPKLAIPLVVAGTLDQPRLLPNAKALIGAAAGTAALGPGLGTAAGAKVQELLEGFIGGKKR